MGNVFKMIIGNKVAIYLLSRYVVYFIIFINSMTMAAHLGPYYMGVWGSIVLILRYFQVFNFGISNSMTVLLVQNKKDLKRCDDLEMSAMVLMGLISLFVVSIGVYYMFVGIPFLDKFELGNRFYFVCLIAIFQYLNEYCFCINRVKGRMFEFTFYQTFLNLILLPIIFLAHENLLITYLIIAYIFSHLISLLLFVFRGNISFRGCFFLGLAKKIVKKSFYIFIYNFCFYLVILSTKTIIAKNYSVEEFGYFSFAYTLAHASLLLLTAFSSLITPKLIDKFNTDDMSVIQKTVSSLRTNYVTCSHCVMYLTMALFPILLEFMPKYQTALIAINLTSLATLLYTNSFGYISLLMAKNKERILALNTFLILVINVCLAWLLAVIIKIDYSYVVLATLFSYLFYACIVVYRGWQFLGIEITFYGIIKEIIPIRLLVPFFVACVMSVVNRGWLMWFPVVVFVVFNLRDLKIIANTMITIIERPNIIDVK